MGKVRFEESPASLYDSLPNLSFDSAPADNPNIVLTSDNSVWGYGAFVEVIAANSITEDFWIYGIGAELINPTIANRPGIIDVAKGGAGSEIVILQGKKGGDSFADVFTHIAYTLPIKVPANTRISCRFAESQAAANTALISVLYLTGL